MNGVNVAQRDGRSLAAVDPTDVQVVLEQQQQQQQQPEYESASNGEHDSEDAAHIAEVTQIIAQVHVDLNSAAAQDDGSLAATAATGGAGLADQPADVHARDLHRNVLLSEHVELEQPQLEEKHGGGAEGGVDAASAPLATASDDAKMGGQINDVRVAVVGNVDSGKSTLIGVLTGGSLDNGRGLARSRIFLHAHEHANGRTSAIGMHILGFDEQRAPVYQTVPASSTAAAKSKSWQQVVAASKSIVTFIDLAGHEKYLKTTIAGLTGCFPDFAIVLINSLAGITKMTKEHLGVVLALDIPLICVVSKVDMVPENVLGRTKDQLFKILKSPAARKMPIQIRSMKDVETVVQNQTASRVCPVFFTSAVNGTHIDLLTSYLSKLKTRAQSLYGPASAPVEFSIDDSYSVTGVGIVVSGTVMSGTVTTGMTLLLGPFGSAPFIEVMVRSLHCKRTPVDTVSAGCSCAISLRAVKRKETLKRSMFRRGMVLIDPASSTNANIFFEADVCILHHPTTIKVGYQAVIHLGMVRQTAQLITITGPAPATATQPVAGDAAAASTSTASSNTTSATAYVPKDCLRTGDRAKCCFRFLQHEEYIHPNTSFVFREGSTKGLGKICRITFTDEEIQHMLDVSDAKFKHRERKQKQAHPVTSLLGGAAEEELKSDDAADVIAAASVLNDTQFGADKRLHSHQSHAAHSKDKGAKGK